MLNFSCLNYSLLCVHKIPDNFHKRPDDFSALLFVPRAPEALPEKKYLLHCLWPLTHVIFRLGAFTQRHIK